MVMTHKTVSREESIRQQTTIFKEHEQHEDKRAVDYNTSAVAYVAYKGI